MIWHLLPKTLDLRFSMPIKLDAIDRRILRALQRDGRLQNQELAKQVGLSSSPCLRRVRLLEDAGVIERYVALVDPAKVALGLTLFVRVWLKRQDRKPPTSSSTRCACCPRWWSAM
jgi:DNA-binding Lrp family transcriptional regulator